ncbi:FABP family protein [Actinomadura parmotrematis]|uniref:Peroxynitrite isomerase n=1 Tax=Actinomadura parmotrematis TaxID=2864039 RepID=A0ABS7G0I0_9ACTN|nr:FABP family protein [Actinomadura parmotrematis]MBW8485337.1 FABP family protein [Actinomadura parmotrematis]
MEPDLHPDLKPLEFLLGTWKGAGVGDYPTIEAFNFGQEVTFGHNGKPFLSYSSRSWLIEPDGTVGRPLATETGYWRPQPGNEIEVTLAHPTGIVEIYVGNLAFHRIQLRTDVVARTATAKEVTAGARMYGLLPEKDGVRDLGWVYEMAAMGQPLQVHLSAQLKKAG